MLDNEIEEIIAKSWNKDKPDVFVFGTTKPSSNLCYGVKAKQVFGKSGAEIAKIVGLGKLKSKTNLFVSKVKFTVISGEVQKPSKVSGVDVFPLAKSVKKLHLGFLREDERLKNDYLRKRQKLPVVWRADDKKPYYMNNKLLELTAKQVGINHWAKRSSKIVRVLPLYDKNGKESKDTDGRSGWFSLGKAVDNKTPKQLEGILGFKKGYLAKGMKAFSADTKSIKPEQLEFKGYTYLPGGKPTDFEGMTKEEIEKELEEMDFPPATDPTVQFVIKGSIKVKKLTATPLGYNEKLKVK